MARPKGKMFALLAVFVAIALVAATGAFTSVEADRTVSVNVSDDSDALLALEPNGSSANGNYASQTGTTVEINLNEDASNVDGAGVNDNATTKIFYIVNVTNQGTQAVDVEAGVSNENSDVEVSVVGNVSNQPNTNAQDVELTSSSVNSLGTGDKMSLGLVIDANNATDVNFNETVTLTAEDSDA
jgi:hypothetical protein